MQSAPEILHKIKYRYKHPIKAEGGERTFKKHRQIDNVKVGLWLSVWTDSGILRGEYYLFHLEGFYLIAFDLCSPLRRLECSRTMHVRGVWA